MIQSIVLEDPIASRTALYGAVLLYNRRPQPDALSG